MAYLGEVFPLGNFHSGVLSSSPCSSPHRVLVTIQGNGSHIYNSVDQKCLRSWSVKPAFKFSHPSFQHHKSNEFYAVREKKTIYAWSEKQEMEKGSLRQTTEEISHILPSPIDDSLIIVYENRNVSILSSQLKDVTTYKKISEKYSEAKILWCHSMKIKSEARILILALYNESYMIFSLIWDPQDKSLGDMESYTLKKVPTGNVFPISCTYENETNLIHVVWSNVNWQIFELVSHGQIHSEIFPKLQIPIGCYDNPLLGLSKEKQNAVSAFGRCGFDCVSIQPSYVAMVGRQKGSNLITIWDSKFGTVHSTQNFERSSQEPSEITEHTEIKIRCSSSSSGGQLIITDLASIWICQFECPQVTLLEVIGKMKDTSKLLDKKGAENLIIPPLSSVNKPFQENWKQVEARDKTEREVIESLVSSKSTPTKESFTSVFMDYVKKEETRKSILSHNFIKSTINRCVLEKNFFAEEVLEYLINSKSVSSSEDNLLSLIISRKNLRLLACFLLNVHDIAEPQLAQILKFILSEVDTKTLSVFVENLQKTEIDVIFEGDHPRDYFLYLIVSAPRNDIFLESCVKSLSFEEVVATLGFLKKMLLRYLDKDEKSLRKSLTTQLPTHAQVIDWVALMLDAHFSQLILTKESHSLLKETQEIVLKQLEACERIETLKGQLEYFMYAKKSTNHGIKTYSVEVLHI